MFACFASFRALLRSKNNPEFCTLALGDFHSATQLARQHVHQLQAKGWGLPPVQICWQADAIIAHLQAFPAVGARA